MVKLTSHNEKETIGLGKRLALLLKPGDIICLSGELGTGKTTLAKGIARGLKINSKKVHSPTFVLLNIYQGKKTLYHFDLYRLEDIAQLNTVGWEEFFYGDGISVVEWAERLGTLKPDEYLEVKLEHVDENTRSVSVTGKGDRYQELLKKLVPK